MIDINTIMSTDLVTIAPHDNLDTARTVMQQKRIHHLPVVREDGTLAGLLTLTDLLSATDSRLREDEDRIPASEILVESVMTTDVATVNENAGLREAALFLEKHRFGCLPVVTNGVLRGIVTDTDFVGVAINLLEQMQESEFDDGTDQEEY